MFDYLGALFAPPKRREPSDLIREAFGLAGIHPHTLHVLEYADRQPGGYRVLALPSSETGTELRRYKLAETRLIYSPADARDDEWLFLTDLGEKVRATLTSGVAPLRVPEQRVPEVTWKPGDSAFWLDPHLWDRTPTLPDGRLDKCWLHLDTKPAPASVHKSKKTDTYGDFLKRQAEQDEKFPCVYIKSRGERCGRCTPCLTRYGRSEELNRRMVYMNDDTPMGSRGTE